MYHDRVYYDPTPCSLIDFNPNTHLFYYTVSKLTCSSLEIAMGCNDDSLSTFNRMKFVVTVHQKGTRGNTTEIAKETFEKSHVFKKLSSSSKPYQVTIHPEKLERFSTSFTIKNTFLSSMVPKIIEERIHKTDALLDESIYVDCVDDILKSLRQDFIKSDSMRILTMGDVGSGKTTFFNFFLSSLHGDVLKEYGVTSSAKTSTISQTRILNEKSLPGFEKISIIDMFGCRGGDENMVNDYMKEVKFIASGYAPDRYCEGHLFEENAASRSGSEGISFLDILDQLSEEKEQPNPVDGVIMFVSAKDLDNDKVMKRVKTLLQQLMSIETANGRRRGLATLIQVKKPLVVLTNVDMCIRENENRHPYEKWNYKTQLHELYENKAIHDTVLMAKARLGLEEDNIIMPFTGLSDSLSIKASHRYYALQIMKKAIELASERKEELKDAMDIIRGNRR